MNATPTDDAIARVLQAEGQARQSIAAAEATAAALVEAARAEAQARRARTERRLRRIAAAFEQDAAQRVADLDAQAAGLARPDPPGDDAVAALRRAVATLARTLVTGSP